MAARAPQFATVLHLSTGHVLTAVTAAGLEPTVEQLTGGRALRVRHSDEPGYVMVPAEALTAARVTATADLLDRPQHYAIGSDGAPWLVGPPEYESGPTRTVGAKAVVVWQEDDRAVGTYYEGVVDATGPPGEPPPGATHLLFAVEGAPLSVEAL